MFPLQRAFSESVDNCLSSGLVQGSHMDPSNTIKRDSKSLGAQSESVWQRRPRRCQWDVEVEPSVYLMRTSASRFLACVIYVVAGKAFPLCPQRQTSTSSANLRTSAMDQKRLAGARQVWSAVPSGAEIQRPNFRRWT